MRSVKNRLEKLFGNTDVDVIFLMNTDRQDSNFVYLTGFTSGVFEGTSLIATKNGLILPVSQLEYEIAREQRPKEMRVLMIRDRAQLVRVLKKHMKSKKIGVNGSFIPYESCKRLRKLAKPKRISDVSRAFYDARSIKDGYELENIKKANTIIKGAMKEAIGSLRIGMTEKELAGFLNFMMMKRGASGTAFETIVAFDKNTALPHHMPDNTRLKANSIVLIDAGAKYNNYCSDITRTLMFRPNRKSQKYRRFMEMYGIVKEAQARSCKMIKAGEIGSKAHASAADYINSAASGKYKGRFIHSLGHAIGIDVHDKGPGLGPSQKTRLEANMVVSNEPGIYVVGFGGVRLEEDIIVTGKGCKVI